MAPDQRQCGDLRSQRHEFMNRLHMIAGLIRMKEYDLVAEIINEVNDEQQRVLDFFLARIKDSAVVGILLGKLHRANELGIQLVIDPQSHLQECCNQRELVVTILGNAIENSFEAVMDSPNKAIQPLVTVYINDETENLIIQVRDNGPGINPEIKEHVMEDGSVPRG
jgi:sensor histidine kinase regulating citrate/malate metabolism